MTCPCRGFHDLLGRWFKPRRARPGRAGGFLKANGRREARRTSYRLTTMASPDGNWNVTSSQLKKPACRTNVHTSAPKLCVNQHVGLVDASATVIAR
jgi:hypothetical protein